jgi:hypothetical protein
MDAPQPQPKKEIAWQPLTFGGAGRFAAAPVGRLWLVQFIFSLIVAAAVIWFLYVDWFPVVSKAARKLPAASEIRAGRLEWQGDPAVLLGENRFVGLAVDVRHAGQARSPSPISIELGSTDFKIFSLLGYVQWAYPRGWIISLSRDEVIAWWGAWSPVILALIAVIVIGVTMLFWTMLSIIRCSLLWLVAFFANRELNFSQSWRLCGAAQLPGALLLAAAIFVYGLGWFALIGLTLAFVTHLIIGWVYSVGSVLKLRPARETANLARNPFAAEKAASAPSPKADLEVPNERTADTTGETDPH